MRLLVTDGRLSQAQYSKADGSIPFTNPVTGVTPTASTHLATKGYVDDAVIALEWQNSVKDQHLTSPPVSIAGYRYIIAAAASGLWTGYEKYIAEYDGSTWSFEAPTEGMAVWMDDEDCVYVYSGTTWVKLGTFVDHGNLIGLTDNDHTQYILHSLGTAIGDMLYATGVGTFGIRAAVAAGSILASNGINAAPVWTSSPSIAGNVTVSTGDILSVFKLGGTPINNRQASIQFNTSSTGHSWAIQYGSSVIGSLGFAPSTTVAGLSFGNPALFMDNQRNVLFGGVVSMGSGATSAIGMGIGVGPGSSPADMAQLWVDDLNGGGTAGFKIRNEDGIDRTLVGAPTSVIGDLLYASAVNTWSLLPDVATGNALISGGVGVLPAYGKVGLTTHVSGILGSGNGGTGNGFAKFSGPTTAEKTFTLPDASATILTSNAAVTAAQGGTGQSSYAVGDLLYASASNALSKLAGVAVGDVLISGGVTTAPSWGKVTLTTHVSGILPSVNGGDGGTTASASGPVTVTTALNRQTYVATGAVEYDLPAGDLSSFVAVGAVPLKYTFVKSAAETLTIDPGAGNFIANGIAAAKLYDDVGGETWATVQLQLVNSAASVNKWVVVGAHGTWAT